MKINRFVPFDTGNFIEDLLYTGTTNFLISLQIYTLCRINDHIKFISKSTI